MSKTPPPGTPPPPLLPPPPPPMLATLGNSPMMPPEEKSRKSEILTKPEKSTLHPIMPIIYSKAGGPMPPPPPFGIVEELRKRLGEKDWKSAQEILKKNGMVLNMLGEDGLTPLQFVIGDGNVEMLKELLKRDDLKIGDGLLHAVRKGDRAMVELMMDFFKKKKMPTDIPCLMTTHFKFYMTPLMLACMEENYDLVGIFLRNGHVLSLPHGYECGCYSCVKAHTMGEKLEDKMHRIDCYSAASSMAFVLYQEDPFDYAMSFGRYLEKCKMHDPIHAVLYDQMIKKLNDVTVSLIDDCDKQEIIEGVLARGPTKKFTGKTCVFGFPRVTQALICHQKQFIAQSSVQSVIYDSYCGSWSDNFHRHPLFRIWRIAMHTILYPFTAIVCLFTSGIHPKTYKNPTARFITSFSSYVVFLAMLIFYTQWKEDRAHLGEPSSVVKLIALIYLFVHLAGMAAVFLTDLHRLGMKRMFDVWWRIFDFIFLLVWLCTFMAFLDAVVHSYGHQYRELHRVHWRPSEPQLIYEIWFTWAAIMSSVRLFYYGQLLSHFGVVTIAISRCIPTILRYVIVLFVVLASFAIGINHLYEHYKDNVVVRAGKDFIQPFQFTSLFTMARYLYWAYYGYLPPEHWGLVVGNVGPANARVEKNHDIMTYTGELMGGVYHVIELIILLNLMVAIMTAAAMAMADKNSIEWKVVRVEIWMEYFQDSHVLPPPINLFQLLAHGLVYSVRKCMRRKQPLSGWDCNYKHPVDDPKKEMMYKAMVSSLKDRLRLKLKSALSEKSSSVSNKSNEKDEKEKEK